MPWVRFDDQYPIHRKVDGLSDAAFRLHTSAIFWSARNLTDGFVSREDLDGVTARVRTPARFAAECVRRGVWHGALEPCDSEKCPGPVDNDGWIIHDYWWYQPTKEQVRRDRAHNARRQALFRNPALKQAVRDRDHDMCRYCGAQVRWGGGQSPRSGTYDHVDPAGENTADNLVIACLACNSRKCDRTAEEAGMQLRPPPGDNGSRNASTQAYVTRPRPGPPLKGGGASARASPNGPRGAKPPWCGHCDERTRCRIFWEQDAGDNLRLLTEWNALP